MHNQTMIITQNNLLYTLLVRKGDKYMGILLKKYYKHKIELALERIRVKWFSREGNRGW